MEPSTSKGKWVLVSPTEHDDGVGRERRLESTSLLVALL